MIVMAVFFVHWFNEFCQRLLFTISLVLSGRIVILGGIAGAGYGSTFIPEIVDSYKELYTLVIGDIPEVVMTLLKPSFDKGVHLFVRVFGLLMGWFLLVFILELIVRGILRVVIGSCRGVGWCLWQLLIKPFTIKTQDLHSKTL